MSLLVRLLLLIGIASLPAIAIVGYNEVELRHAREAEVRDQTLRIARETAAELERTIEGIRGLLVTLAELPVIRDQDSAACNAFLQDPERSVALASLAARAVAGQLEVPPAGAEAPP